MPPADIEPCGTIEIPYSRHIDVVDRVDLLFVIDDSRSMDPWRTSVALEVTRMVRALASGDRNGDGIADFAPVQSLHVGVITTDFGTSAGGVASCDAGEGGVLVRASTSSDGARCVGVHPTGIFDFVAGTDDPSSLANAVGCGASIGTGGCGVEQPLEAVLRALSVGEPTTWTREDYDPPIFADGAFGHGDRANAGFLRGDSVLSVIVITDEDDCSVADVGAELAGVDETDPDPSCLGGGGLQAIERFVGGLQGLRRYPSRIIFTVVGGVPSGTDLSFDAILAAPEMQATLDPSRPGHLRPSCAHADGRTATPPRRLVEVAQALDERGTTSSALSLCDVSLAPALDLLLEKLASAPVGHACLPRALELDDEGRANCDVIAVLAPPSSGEEVTHCAQIGGAVRLADEMGRWGSRPVVHEVCRLPALTRAQAIASSGGWFYDDGDPRLGTASTLPAACRQDIRLSGLRLNGSELRADCPVRSGDLPLCDE